MGGKLLWYAVAAWTEKFGGSVVDYGCFPRQNRTVCAASDARPTLADQFPRLSEPQRVYAGLTALTGDVLGRISPRVGGGEVKIERCLVDAGGVVPVAAVRQFVRASSFASILFPSIGRARSTTQTSVSEWIIRAGERTGHGWKLTLPETNKGQPVIFDADIWKSTFADALTVPLGGPTSVTLGGPCVDVASAIQIQPNAFAILGSVITGTRAVWPW